MTILERSKKDWVGTCNILNRNFTSNKTPAVEKLMVLVLMAILEIVL